jgi:steroid 5-alpha reductase family enzyme
VNPFLLSALCIFTFMCVMFVIAQLIKDNSIVDVGWGIGFILVAVVTLTVYGDGIFKQRLVSYLVIMWGLRLSLYLMIRNAGRPEDFRYAAWRKEWGDRVMQRSFFRIFMLQGLVMFINTLPVVIVNSGPSVSKKYVLLSCAGTALWVVGFFLEGMADKQLFDFKSDPHPHKNKVMKKGLWKYSRHPNYFGEALMWWGIFLLAIPSGYWYISILAPLTITFLLLKVSGVTMLEKKYEGNDEYSLYKKTTSAFLPWFPKKQEA